MQRVEVERTLNHPIEAVFDRHTDHEGWSEWAGLGPVLLAKRGAPDRDGVGAIRAFKWVPGLQEEVIRFERPSLIAYTVIQGAYPMADHHGEVRFAKVGDGATRVTWIVTFRSRVPGLGWPIERGITLLFRRMLASLTRDLDRRLGR